MLWWYALEKRYLFLSSQFLLNWHKRDILSRSLVSAFFKLLYAEVHLFLPGLQITIHAHHLRLFSELYLWYVLETTGLSLSLETHRRFSWFTSSSLRLQKILGCLRSSVTMDNFFSNLYATAFILVRNMKHSKMSLLKSLERYWALFFSLNNPHL